MKRFPSTPYLLVAALAASGVALADQGGAGPHGGPGGFALRGLERCLASIDLPDATRANAQALLTTGKATLKADGAAMKAAHSKLETDMNNGADKAVIGQDTLDVDATKTKMKNDAQAIHDQVLAQLSQEQQNALGACASTHWGHGHGPGTGSAQPPAQ
ncbi:MAG TPA: hypothetical protein VMN82_07050 [Thermoanaerobaculia bacterium]|nr:hypothetical protein [Thermoanaerobaculia bacterium]